MKKNTASKPTVGIIMGSQSDWSTMGEAAALLKQLDIPLETKIVSAHRTPKLLYSYAEEAEERGIQVRRRSSSIEDAQLIAVSGSSSAARKV